VSDARITLEAARAAKEEAKRRFSDRGGIVGIGVTRHGKGYAVKVNLGGGVDPATLPQTVNGVPVVFEVVGTIRKR
jgi:hypothetical protein